LKISNVIDLVTTLLLSFVCVMLPFSPDFAWILIFMSETRVSFYVFGVIGLLPKLLLSVITFLLAYGITLNLTGDVRRNSIGE